MGLLDLHVEEFKLFSMEYNNDHDNDAPNTDIEYFVPTLEHQKQDYDPGTNDMFLNNLDPTFYAMQVQNPDVLTHTQMKRQVDTDNFFDKQLEGLQEIETFEYIPK
jgi:hypothetical protein